MKLSEPIGNPAWAAFFIRVAVGAWLLADGLIKVSAYDQTVSALTQGNLFPGHANTVYAIAVPWIQVFAGGLILAGMWTILAGILASLVVITYIIPAGAFAGANKLLINKDIFVLLGALSLLYSGAGALSIDKFRSSS